jgi:hypothetical protein
VQQHRWRDVACTNREKVKVRRPVSLHRFMESMRHRIRIWASRRSMFDNVSSFGESYRKTRGEWSKKTVRCRLLPSYLSLSRSLSLAQL